MRALLSEAPGGPETLVLRDIDPPVAGPGQLLIDVKACAINFPDVLIIEDKYQLKPPRPFAPGSEIAGVVSALGEGVSGFAVGDRVIAATGFGGLVETVAVAINLGLCAARSVLVRTGRGAADDLRHCDPRAARPRADERW